MLAGGPCTMNPMHPVSQCTNHCTGQPARPREYAPVGGIWVCPVPACMRATWSTMATDEDPPTCGQAGLHPHGDDWVTMERGQRADRSCV